MITTSIILYTAFTAGMGWVLDRRRRSRITTKAILDVLHADFRPLLFDSLVFASNQDREDVDRVVRGLSRRGAVKDFYTKKYGQTFEVRHVKLIPASDRSEA